MPLSNTGLPEKDGSDTDTFGQSIKRIQDEHKNLIAENERLKSQVQDQSALNDEIENLKRMDEEHRRITEIFEKLARQYNGKAPWYEIPDFWVCPEDLPDIRSHSDELVKNWMTFAEKELGFAEEAREGRWKEKITELEERNEQQQREMQIDINTARLNVADLQEKYEDLQHKNEELEQHLHEREQSEKNCHQIINHIENLMAAHPGETTTANPINNLHTVTSGDAVQRFAEWAAWVEEELRCAKEIEEIKYQSRKRRKTHVTYEKYESATPNAIEEGEVPVGDGSTEDSSTEASRWIESGADHGKVVTGCLVELLESF